MGRTDKNQKTKRSILCCDPSMTAFGWVIIDWKGSWVDGGCIQTKKEDKIRKIRKGDDDVRRVSVINHALLKEIKAHRVNFIVSELPSGTQSASAATMLGMVKGLVQATADALEIKIEWWSEGDSKTAAFGKGKKVVSKQDMINKMNTLYKVRWAKHQYVNEAMADATAIHNAACKFSSVSKLKQK